MTTTRRSSQATRIPEEVQATMRNRLQLLRVSKGLSRTAINTVSDGTMQLAELHDISKLRFGDLYGLALEYGLSFTEFMQYLIGDVDHEVTDEARHLQRMAVFLRSMTPELQELACDLVQKLVAYHVDNRGMRQVNNAPGIRRESRTILQQAIADQQRQRTAGE